MADLDAITADDLTVIEQHMRPIDRLEFDAMTEGAPVSETLRDMVSSSIRSRAGRVNGRLVAIYGVGAKTVLSPECCPWLLTTREIERPEVRRAFIAASRGEAAWLMAGHRLAWNLVHRDNHIARRWLRWMGFDFPATDPIVVSGEPFLYFEKGIDHVR